MEEIVKTRQRENKRFILVPIEAIELKEFDPCISNKVVLAVPDLSSSIPKIPIKFLKYSIGPLCDMNVGWIEEPSPYLP